MDRAYEYNDAGKDVPKEQSNRYCHNMTENGLDRVITYKFELPEEGEYTVKVGLTSPWGNSVPADLYLNGSLAAEGIMAMSDECGVATATASPVDGFITVEGKTDMPTLNMAYIIISKVPEPEPEPEAAPEQNESSEEPEAPEAEAAAEATPEEAPAETALEPAPESAPEQTSPKTGLALATVPAVMAMAGAAIAKRR